ncbi:MAG: zinc ABC transporter substrate-binding protein [Rhizobiaceae bacterium]|nr:zinc ABC transporter substrate-binding protein [Rhizobiaceae bacterium]
MRFVLAALAATGSLLTLAGAHATEAPKVVASIKPIHSLVSAVMEGVGEPSLIVDGAGSPHTYAMKPSQAAELEAANLVFWAGDGLEAFLVKPIETLGAKAKMVELIDAPGLERLSYREGGAFEAHRDDDGHAQAASHESHDQKHGSDHEEHEKQDEHDASTEAGHGGNGEDQAHGAYDMHFWLDPLNAKALVDTIEASLSKADPTNAARYASNAAALEVKLDALVAATTADLASVKDKPFVVFHDAYQYFEKRFGVTAAGSITVSPETIPGVQRIAEIQAKVKSLGATCVFAEPQFQPKLVSVVTEGTSARTGVLDPEGASLKNGPNLYFELIEGLTASLKDCLSRQS